MTERGGGEREGERERAEEAHAQLCKQVSFEIAFKVLGMLCIYVDAEGRGSAGSFISASCVHNMAYD